MQQLVKIRISRHIRAHDQEIHKESNERFNFRTIAIGDDGPDENVLLPRVAMEQHIKRSEQRHEQRYLLVPAQLFQLLRQFLRNDDRLRSSIESLKRRARLIDGQLKHGRSARQLIAPIIELRGEHFTLQPIALPIGEIRILNWQLHERRRFAVHISAVKRSHLVDEDPHGPPIRNDVVHRRQGNMLFRSETQHVYAQEWSMLEIKRPLRLLMHEARRFRFPFFPRQLAQIDHRLHDARRRRDDLHCVSVNKRKRGSQHFMTACDFHQRPFERVQIQLTRQSHSHRHVIERRSRL